MYVISTLSADTRYVKWVTHHGVRSIERGVLVRGGALVATGGVDHPTTPNGVRTEISADDAKFLADHDLFKEHQTRGFVKIVAAAKDPESVAEKMEKDDGSRPRTDEDVAAVAKKSKDGVDSLKATTNKVK